MKSAPRKWARRLKEGAEHRDARRQRKERRLARRQRGMQ